MRSVAVRTTGMVCCLLIVVGIGVVPGRVSANFFTVPATSSPPVSSFFDHDDPDYTTDDNFVKYTGEAWIDGSASLDDCVSGLNCYDGHNGVDFNGDFGDQILAATDGAVSSIYWNDCSGWTMSVWHEDLGLSTLYAHIATTTAATTSQVVSRGNYIADMDSTGDCATGAHLHFGVMDGYSTTTSERIDPYGWWGTSTDPWAYNQDYLWTTDPPSYDLAKTASTTISTDTAWRGNFRIDSYASVDSGITLTIEPGTIIKFGAGAYLQVDGTLNAQGTAAHPIYFTSIKDDSVGGDTNGDGSSTTPGKGDWGYIQLSNNSTSSISNAVIRYGGYPSYPRYANFYVEGGYLSATSTIFASSSYYGLQMASGTVKIASSTFKNNSYVGFFANGSGNLSVTSSTFTGNGIYTGSSYGAGYVSFDNGIVFESSGNTASGNSWNGFEMGGAYMNEDQTWGRDIPHILASPLRVSSTKTLVLDRGTAVKFNIDPQSSLIVGGVLSSFGTSSDKVYITSLRDDSVGNDTNNDGDSTSPAPGDWSSIMTDPDSSSTLSYTVVRYGGANNYPYYSEFYLNGGAFNIWHSVIASSTNYGVTIASGTLDIASSSITAIGSYGVNNLTNATSSAIARENWWGTSSGPTHSSNPNGTGISVTDYVDFNNWLSSEP